MKNLLLIIAIVALHCVVQAQPDASQTNASATNRPVESLSNDSLMGEATEIFSDRGDFDLKTEPYVAIYTGHVRVINPQLKLTCEVLTATLPKSGGHADRIVADRNVVIDAKDSRGEPIHATGDRAIYTYKVENSVTNELIELTGDPHVVTPLRSATGDSIIWDRINNKFSGTNLHMTFQQPTKNTSTNKPPVSLTPTNTP